MQEEIVQLTCRCDLLQRETVPDDMLHALKEKLANDEDFIELDATLTKTTVIGQLYRGILKDES
eukprot:2327997-Ditylum_brightwellii.AAC.1